MRDVGKSHIDSERRKTKTIVITLANHSKNKLTSNQQTNQNSKQINVARDKRGKTRSTKTQLVFLLIGRESGASSV